MQALVVCYSVVCCSVIRCYTMRRKLEGVHNDPGTCSQDDQRTGERFAGISKREKTDVCVTGR
jgi:hypothetical protein